MTEHKKREKVIKGLEVCSPTGCAKEKCPYYEGPESEFWGNPDGYECEFNLRQDAIKLLKAQEALRPVPDTSYGARPWWFVCGNCKLSVNEDQKYCPNCGRAVKWK